MEFADSNNKAELTGVIEGEPVFSHEIYGEAFYLVILCVPRLSGASDHIRVIVSERLCADGEIRAGESVTVRGQFRSYNAVECGTSRLILSVFAYDIFPVKPCAQTENPNTLYLNGFLCKPPNYRTTPFGREICDMLLAVNRTYNKSDYIPVIAWGRNARFANRLSVGSNIRIWGRIQSRIYQKRLCDGSCTEKTAYEVSICRMEM